MASLFVAIAMAVAGCAGGQSRPAAESSAQSSAPFPEPSELYEQLLARIEQAGTGHSEGEFKVLYPTYEFTSDFATGSAGDFVQTKVAGRSFAADQIDATILRLGGDLFVQNAEHPTRPTAWLQVAEGDQINADPLLTAAIRDLFEDSTPAFGIAPLRHAQRLELVRTSPLAAYEGVIDLTMVDPLGISSLFKRSTQIVEPFAEVKIFVNSDGLPERMKVKVEIGTSEDGIFAMLDIFYSEWGDPIETPSRPVDIFDSAEEFFGRSEA